MLPFVMLLTVAAGAGIAVIRPPSILTLAIPDLQCPVCGAKPDTFELDQDHLGISKHGQARRDNELPVAAAQKPNVPGPNG